MNLEETLYGIRNLVNDQDGQIETLQKLNEGLAKKLEETYEEVEQLKAKLAEFRARHLKHPTGDYCVYCLSQWPCEAALRGER